MVSMVQRKVAAGLGKGIFSGVCIDNQMCSAIVYQIGHGMMNTLHSISSVTQEKYWDEDKHEWVETNGRIIRQSVWTNFFKLR
jgi:hypothetical protein